MKRETLRRTLALVVHNWPLKLAAIGLACLLYAGVVLSQNVQTFPGPVQVVPLGQPTNAVIVGNLPSVTDIRYVAPTDVASQVTTASFTAWIDLTGVQPTTAQPVVSAEVHLDVADKRIRVISFENRFISVQLDPLTRKTVPVRVKPSPIPSGLEVGAPQVSVQTAVVSGPDSKVRQVVAAEAPVLIQSSGLDVHQDVPLVAVDGLDNAVTPVDVDPQTVHVDIRVGSQLVTRTLPVNPVVTGSPPAGYRIASVTVNPSVVSVQGDADTLAAMTTADTAPISVAQATSPISTTVPLALPDGVVVTGGGSTVSVTVGVQAVTGSRDFVAGLVLAGTRDDRRYGLSTDQVIVTVSGSIQALDALGERGLIATLDVTGLALGSRAVDVKVSVPAGLRVSAVSPASITVSVSVAPPSPSPSPSPSPGAS